jgi:peptide/nickel transport system permease protein
MAAYFLGRAGRGVIALFVVSIVAFLLLHATPGDPIITMLGPDATPQMARDMRHRLGLDLPLSSQYLAWIRQLLRGDLGVSIRTGQPVLTLIVGRLPTTASLAVLATLVSLLLGVGLGIVAAANRGRLWDQAATVAAVLGISLPNFFVGLLLMILFSVLLRWLPISGPPVDLLRAPAESLRTLLLPTLALGASYAALVARMTRSSLVEVLSAEYIRTAYAKGVHPSRVLLRHALRNASIPVLTTVAINFAYLLGGTIIIEQIFALPGVGRLLLQGVEQRDYPIIQGIVLLMSAAFVCVNMLADFLFGVIDPRIRLGKAGE